MSETDPRLTAAAPELLTFLTDGAAAPAPAALPATGRLRPPSDAEQQPIRRSDPREGLTDGIVELRKRRPWSGPGTGSPEARTPGSDAPW
ncbi:hypothetical protein OHA37_05185 [Streptomyces sp. NBC_00335]|uniref:hypothetical protein n=1 Tax=unclassified Streptomyces TaxID=2593676 RepID=UPI002250ED3F|nr:MULTISPECIES: hypothetical protein [unclassified Streptomyces]MCX5403274.1 hypothetical protein [Streptomyces sp. NBC_00086]